MNQKLAEFVGIMLGDGCNQLRTNQITISCGTIDGNYISEYIPNLINHLFSKKVSFRKISYQGLDCIFASKEVSNLLANEMHLKSPKINCKIPKQFFSNYDELKACIRGMFDTDGGLHRHHKKSAQLKFTNKSHSMVWSLYKALTQLKYRPSITVDHKEKNTLAIYLFDKDVKKYFEEVGSNNPKNNIKFNNWIENGVVPLNKEIENQVKLSKKVQEKLLGKGLEDVKISGFCKNK